MDTGIQAKTTTDDNGNYDFFNVRVGRYSIAVEHSGFPSSPPRTWRPMWVRASA